jgi:hypothetical protein
MLTAVTPDPDELAVAEQSILADISARISGAEDQGTHAALCRLNEIFQRLRLEHEALSGPHQATDDSGIMRRSFGVSSVDFGL